MGAVILSFISQPFISQHGFVLFSVLAQPPFSAPVIMNLKHRKNIRNQWLKARGQSEAGAHV